MVISPNVEAMFRTSCSWVGYGGEDGGVMTIQRVAELAGVSTATVSRALAGKSTVSDADAAQGRGRGQGTRLRGLVRSIQPRLRTHTQHRRGHAFSRRLVLHARSQGRPRSFVGCRIRPHPVPPGPVTYLARWSDEPSQGAAVRRVSASQASRRLHRRVSRTERRRTGWTRGDWQTRSRDRRTHSRRADAQH